MKINNYLKRHAWPFAQLKEQWHNKFSPSHVLLAFISFGLHCLLVARSMQPCFEVVSYVTIKIWQVGLLYSLLHFGSLKTNVYSK